LLCPYFNSNFNRQLEISTATMHIGDLQDPAYSQVLSRKKSIGKGS